MKTLVVYYSYTQNNETLARLLGQKLKCDTLKIEEEHKRTWFTIFLDLLFNRTPRIKPHLCDVGAYNQYIFVAPVWAGKIASPLKSFLVRERFYISNYSFITLCGGGNSNQKEKLVTVLTELLGHEPGVVRELWVNDLLGEEKKNTIKNTSGYRVAPADMAKFETAIDDFLSSVEALYELKRMAG